jgi:hypothetical protein
LPPKKQKVPEKYLPFPFTSKVRLKFPCYGFARRQSKGTPQPLPAAFYKAAAKGRGLHTDTQIQKKKGSINDYDKNT